MIEVVHTDNIDHFGSWVEVGMIVGVVIAGALTAILPILSRRKSNKSNQLKYPDRFNWDAHSRIHERLTELRVKTDCARTQVVQFHNGGHFLDGISMKKMSLTHESLANGCSSEMETKRDLLMSLCLEGLELLRQDDAKFQQLMENIQVMNKNGGTSLADTLGLSQTEFAGLLEEMGHHSRRGLRNLTFSGITKPLAEPEIQRSVAERIEEVSTRNLQVKLLERRLLDGMRIPEFLSDPKYLNKHER